MCSNKDQQPRHFSARGTRHSNVAFATDQAKQLREKRQPENSDHSDESNGQHQLKHGVSGKSGDVSLRRLQRSRRWRGEYFMIWRSRKHHLFVLRSACEFGSYGWRETADARRIVL